MKYTLSEINEMIRDYCIHDCEMRDWCCSNDCPINEENYMEYLFPEEEDYE